MLQTLRNSFILISLMLLCVSCAGKPEVGITEDTIYDQPMPEVDYKYELGPGDTLEIIYHFTPKPDSDAYYISVGDVIKVEFAYHKDINRQLTVRPDGNVAMPKKGNVNVLGLTPAQLQEKLQNLYDDDFRDPLVTITMIQFNRAIEHLKTAITTAPRGQSKLTMVRPDGYISFPMIPDIMARGKTVPELKAEAIKGYKKIIDNLTVSLILKIMKANLVYITGQVERPNSYLMDGPQTVSQVIAKAGGVKNTAERSTVLVISRDKDRKPWGRLVNLQEIYYEGNIGKDILLHQYDIVFVPMKSISRRNLFVEQYINGLIPEDLIGPYRFESTSVKFK